QRTDGGHCVLFLFLREGRRRDGAAWARPLGGRRAIAEASIRLARVATEPRGPRTTRDDARLRFTARAVSVRRAMADMIRIANAGGYWGDDLAQFRRQIELGPVDVVTLDFLAEITMSIMQKQRARDPKSGYARDFIVQVESALPLLVER